MSVGGYPSQARAMAPRRARQGRFKLKTAPLILIGLVTAFLAVRSGTPGPVWASGAALAAIITLLWRNNEPPILVFPLLYQWSEVSVKPILSGLNKVPLNSLAEFNIDLAPGAYFGLAGIVALSVGAAIIVSRDKTDWMSVLMHETKTLPYSIMLRLSLSIMLGGVALGLLGRLIPSLSQLFIAISNLGLCGLFIVAFWTFANGRGFGVMIPIALFEIGIGFTGYFADFRSPVLILVLAALCARPKFKLRDILLLAVLGIMVIFLVSFWSAIKRDYRMFVSGGTMSQSISVPLSAQIDFLSDRVSKFDRAEFDDGFSRFLSRHSYIDFLSATIAYVPSGTPHTNGGRIGQTVLHVLMPRFLFPDKPPTEFDSEVTIRYTGLDLMAYQNTSISIGYVGELYIDFGLIGGVLTMLLIGILYGMGFRTIQSLPGPLIVRYAACAAIVVFSGTFGTALIKLVGGVVTTGLAAHLMIRFGMPTLLRVIRAQGRPQLRSGPPRLPSA